MVCFHRLGLFFCAIVMVVSTPGWATSESVIERLIDEISLDALDEIIEDASYQINLLKSLQGNQDSTPQTETDVAAVQDNAASLTRTRANLLCFNNNVGQHKSLPELDSYFDEIDGRLRLGSTLLAGFDSLKLTFAEGNCDAIMVDMTKKVEAETSSVSAQELALLVLHLQSCWPDEGVKEADGSAVDIDARYYRALNLVQQSQQTAARLNSAKAYCE